LSPIIGRRLSSVVGHWSWLLLLLSSSWFFITGLEILSISGRGIQRAYLRWIGEEMQCHKINNGRGK